MSSEKAPRVRICYLWGDGWSVGGEKSKEQVKMSQYFELHGGGMLVPLTYLGGTEGRFFFLGTSLI